MRKQIDIPDDVKIQLQILAVKSGKDLKNYIQDLLIEHAKQKGETVNNAWMLE